jgi:hypothetical protein
MNVRVGDAGPSGDSVSGADTCHRGCVTTGRAKFAEPEIGRFLGQVRTLSQTAWGRADEDELTVARGAAKAYEHFFKLPLGALGGTAKIVVDGEDILLARWPVQVDSRVSEVLVWDEPTVSTYVFPTSVEIAMSGTKQPSWWTDCYSSSLPPRRHSRFPRSSPGSLPFRSGSDCPIPGHVPLGSLR